MILNGVCVIWKGWIDLQRLDGMGCLEFDEERAQVRSSACCALDVCLFFWKETLRQVAITHSNLLVFCLHFEYKFQRRLTA